MLAKVFFWFPPFGFLKCATFRRLWCGWNNTITTAKVTYTVICLSLSAQPSYQHITDSGNHSPSSAAAAFWSIDMNGISLVRCFVIPGGNPNQCGTNIFLSPQTKKSSPPDDIGRKDGSYICTPAAMIDDKWLVYTESWNWSYEERLGTLVLVAAATTRGLVCVLYCVGKQESRQAERRKAEGRDGGVLTGIPFTNPAQWLPGAAESESAPGSVVKKHPFCSAWRRQKPRWTLAQMCFKPNKRTRGTFPAKWEYLITENWGFFEHAQGEKGWHWQRAAASPQTCIATRNRSRSRKNRSGTETKNSI